ncbi:branched-chain amino acid ABC transporter permease [Salinigranum rubrum]|uniref:Branched-chain amino acid ABC transporter permease n=1 Tax=Salinigranum rubrum TaxID=755307 RepID=A0A2I8VNI1_9EURY|nr:AzlC family ABC transporter permease [Salinigranum rubrum]AUV83471.1 branched-chain amino acid ABC transporter permease [Salinigranum rubrum]
MSRLPPAAREGVRTSLPLVVSIVPFGLVAGVAAVDAGLSPVAALGMSVVVFAGAAQLAVIDLLGRDASLVVAVVTGVVVNLRMMMYSASIAPYFQRYRARWKAFLAFFLTDQAYAVSIARFEARDGEERDASGERGDWFYLGVGASLWVGWVVTTAVGVGLGRGLPDSWGLDFAVPLIFLALLVPRIEDGTTAAAGVVAGLVALFGSGLPYELGLPLAAAVGVGVGLVAEEVRGR